MIIKFKYNRFNPTYRFTNLYIYYKISFIQFNDIQLSQYVYQGVPEKI